MIFAPENCELILKGIKTQTRRPRGPADSPYYMWTAEEFLGPNPPDPSKGRIIKVHRKGRLFWAVGKTYAIKPKRTAKQTGRIKLLSIRLEKVRDISSEDAIAEGATLLDGMYVFTVKGKTFRGLTPRAAYLEGWKDFYKKSDLKEEVWVLTFRKWA